MRVWEPLKLEDDSLTLLQIKNNATMIKRINLKTLILVEVVCCKFWGLKAWGRRMYRLQHSFSYHDLFDLWLNEKKLLVYIKQEQKYGILLNKRIRQRIRERESMEQAT